MLEIFALPYFAVSGVIGWVIFQPFFRSEDTDARVSIATTDLLAIALPVSILFLLAKWMMPVSILSLAVQAVVVASALVFASATLAVGLFLVTRTTQVTFPKRLAVVGIIAPFGIFLTLGWVGLLIWPCVHSMMYLAPTSIAIAFAAYGLRLLGSWVCQESLQK